ncbi:MAG TPA: hypothetical protein VGF25_06025 [Thermoleophilaceae bacterium]|jgi:hypothetical protein
MNDREPHSAEVPPDPLGVDEPHDVLAAEEFGIGDRDNRFPPDPTGIQEPHDVLAAEEFAMPAGSDTPAAGASGPDPRTWLPMLVILAGIAALVVMRRRR